ncbi:MAG TPA: HlyD family efflux transporter periplasmic adaptor subunit [Verrucomicrobiae bacterium]|nr:HlyD family efflux transporter periplasmic adaptor subunit [Verrucomicrobiae bacterium]
MRELPPAVPLFRPEAVAPASGGAFAGAALLPEPRAMRLLLLLTAAVLLGLGAVLVLGEFTQRVRATGWIAPAGGLARVVASRTGVLAELHVRESERVRRGQALLTLATARPSSSSPDAGRAVLAALQRERDELDARLSAQRELHAAGRERVAHELAAGADQHRRLARRVALLAQQRDLSRAEADRTRELVARGLLARVAAERGDGALLAAEAAFQELDQQRVAARSAIAALRIDSASLPAQAQSAESELRGQRAALDLRIAEAEAALDTVVASPVDGRVSGLALAMGQAVAAGSLLLMVIPESDAPQAQLWLPARLGGAIREGAEVRLRLHSAPAHAPPLSGTVVQLSRAALAPADQQGPVTLREPAYRVSVALRARVDSEALQPGALVEAGVARERRRLIDWLLEPLERAAP